MLTVCLIAGCLALGQTDSAPGDSPADAEQAAQVRRLVRQLDAPEKARRDDAEQQLRALGPGVVGLLPQADERLPAEVQLRVRRLRDEFEQAQAEASTQASHITLDAKGMPLGDVLAALTRQSGNKLVDLRPQFGEAARNEPLNVHFEKTAFWPALDD
ncbi:MAG TPA: hypothetical protein VG433_17545, partial [Pirellulales bacterium]|nr:hypothetical protein [Pirellulales bacterium]